MVIEGNQLRTHSIHLHEYEFIDHCQKRERICLKPDTWQKIWEMSPKKYRKSAGCEPLPFILAAGVT